MSLTNFYYLAMKIFLSVQKIVNELAQLLLLSYEIFFKCQKNHKRAQIF